MTTKVRKPRAKAAKIIRTTILPSGDASKGKAMEFKNSLPVFNSNTDIVACKNAIEKCKDKKQHRDKYGGEAVKTKSLSVKLMELHALGVTQEEIITALDRAIVRTACNAMKAYKLILS